MNETPATAALITTADRSVKAIAAATAGLAKVVADVVALNDVVETLSADIQQKEGQLVDLERQLGINTRLNAAELNVRVAEGEETVLMELMSKRDLARITIAERNAIEQSRDDALANTNDAVASAVKAAESSLHARYKSEISNQTAEFKVANAELVADLRAVRERNTFLTEELVKARQDLTAERDARIKIAQAEATRQGVVVNAGKQ